MAKLCYFSYSGLFGAYLQDNWELLHDMISQARKSVNIGITAKIRVFPTVGIASAA